MVSRKQVLGYQPPAAAARPWLVKLPVLQCCHCLSSQALPNALTCLFNDIHSAYVNNVFSARLVAASACHSTG